MHTYIHTYTRKPAQKTTKEKTKTKAKINKNKTKIPLHNLRAGANPALSTQQNKITKKNLAYVKQNENKTRQKIKIRLLPLAPPKKQPKQLTKKTNKP